MSRRSLAGLIVAFATVGIPILGVSILKACDPADRIRMSPFADPAMADIPVSLFYQGWGIPRASR